MAEDVKLDPLGKLEMLFDEEDDDQAAWEVSDDVYDLFDGEVKRIVGSLLTEKAIECLDGEFQPGSRKIEGRIGVIVGRHVTHALKDARWKWELDARGDGWVSPIMVKFDLCHTTKKVDLLELAKSVAKTDARAKCLARYLRAVADQIDPDQVEPASTI